MVDELQAEFPDKDIEEQIKPMRAFEAKKNKAATPHEKRKLAHDADTTIEIHSERESSDTASDGPRKKKCKRSKKERSHSCHDEKVSGSKTGTKRPRHRLNRVYKSDSPRLSPYENGSKAASRNKFSTTAEVFTKKHTGQPYSRTRNEFGQCELIGHVQT